MRLFARERLTVIGEAMEGVENHKIQAIAEIRLLSNPTSVAVMFSAVYVGETCSKPHAPAFGQELDVQRSLQRLMIGGFRGVKSVHFCDGEGGLLTSEEFKLIPGVNFSFFDDRKIEAATAATHEVLDHVIAFKFGREFKTRKPGRRYPDHSRAHAVAVSDGNGRFEEPFCSEILAEGSPGTGWIGKLGVPSGIVFGRIAVDGFVRAAVYREVGLPVAIEIGRPQHHSPFHGVFENAGFESSASPGKQTRQADVDRNELHIRMRRRQLCKRCRFLNSAAVATIRAGLPRVFCRFVPSSYRIKSLLDCTASRKRVSSGLESSQYATSLRDMESL